jgi:hypothetical protein
MNDDQDTRANTAPSQADVAATVDIAQADTEDGIGYRLPPKRSQFRPRQNGNPRGRPPGVKSLCDIVRNIRPQRDGRRAAHKRRGRQPSSTKYRNWCLLLRGRRVATMTESRSRSPT